MAYTFYEKSHRKHCEKFIIKILKLLGKVNSKSERHAKIVSLNLGKFVN